MSGASKLILPYSQVDEGLRIGQSELIGKARKSLRAFTLATHKRYNMNWHQVRTCDALMRWVTGEWPFLIIQQPPRHGKSELGSRRLPAFILGQNPNNRIIATSYGDTLASKMNRDVQRIMDTPVYQQIFPNTKLGQRNIKTYSQGSVLRNSSEFGLVGYDGGYYSAGVGGAITGMGADFFIIDDPVKNHKDADSETYREATWEWFHATASTRLEDNPRILLIMTRWHEDDLAGRLIAQAKSDPKAYQWKVLNFEAIREDMTDELDPRLFGEPLWPQKYDAARFELLKASMPPRWWNALYQQRPSALEGGIIKNSWIKYWGDTKKGADVDKPPVFHEYTQSWDFTFKDSKGSDWVVGLVWGVYAGKKYLLHMYRERVDFVGALDAIKAVSKLYPQAHTKLIEEKANGAAIISSLKSKNILGLIPIVPKESKDARLSACSPQFHAGDVYLPHPDHAPWVKLVVDELVKFPNARYDDIVDAISQYLNYKGGGLDLLDKLTRM